ncbi:unnamed protein product [Didymodactylos carnosus]|nr:unnamed protein product [Didymodactylos carnosus]CAF4184099.1 unnamed protein product [Didymodactylos carnosus]
MQAQKLRNCSNDFNRHCRKPITLICGQSVCTTCSRQLSSTSVSLNQCQLHCSTIAKNLPTNYSLLTFLLDDSGGDNEASGNGGEMEYNDYIQNLIKPHAVQEVLKLIILALEDGSAMTRKSLILSVIEKLQSDYHHLHPLLLPPPGFQQQQFPPVPIHMSATAPKRDNVVLTTQAMFNQQTYYLIQQMMINAPFSPNSVQQLSQQLSYSSLRTPDTFGSNIIHSFAPFHQQVTLQKIDEQSNEKKFDVDDFYLIDHNNGQYSSLPSSTLQRNTKIP